MRRKISFTLNGKTHAEKVLVVCLFVQRMIIARASFQQQNPVDFVFAQPIGEHTTRAARANNDVIVLRHEVPSSAGKRPTQARWII